MKILIVDDSIVMRSMIKRALESAGVSAQIFEAGDGVQAMAQLTENPNLILCDWKMPNMDGIEFLRRIRSQGHEIPLVMVTSENSPEKKKQAFDAGASGFLMKPFSAEELIQEIKEMVSS